MTVEAESPEAIFRSIFLRAKERNPSFSMRAFAKSVGMSVTMVSLVMSGRRPASPGSVKKVILRGKLSSKERLTLVQWLSDKSKNVNDTLPQNEEVFTVLSVDHFGVIAAPEHFEILTYLSMRRAKGSLAGIASDLNLEEESVSQVIERLARLRLIRKEKRRYIPTNNALETPKGVASKSIRAYHRAKLDKYIENLEALPVEARDFSCISMVIQSKKIAQFRDDVEVFRRHMFKKYHDTEHGDQVMDLACQIQPVSRVIAS